MTSIFRRALGADFDRLQPELQRRFGVGLDEGYACVGKGTMFELKRGPWWTLPFLYLGVTRNIMYPERANGVPFEIENYPYTDGFGRETVTFVRTMHLSPRRRRRFDATMIFSEDTGRIVDYLGTHQHLAVDLDLSVQDDGSLLLRSGAQRLYEGFIGFTFPGLFTGTAELRERFDAEAGKYRISLQVRNRVFGFLFGYEGEFECEFPEAVDAPVSIKPYREEARQ